MVGISLTTLVIVSTDCKWCFYVIYYDRTKTHFLCINWISICLALVTVHNVDVLSGIAWVVNQWLTKSMILHWKYKEGCQQESLYATRIWQDLIFAFSMRMIVFGFNLGVEDISKYIYQFSLQSECIILSDLFHWTNIVPLFYIV